MNKKILDLDMDFFLNEIANWKNGEDRLDSDIYKPWSEQEFRKFLEEKCLLDKNDKIKGRIITHHNQAFDFWEELYNLDRVPFSVTHIDAHADLGFGDSSYLYIMKELLHITIEERLEHLQRNKVYSGNFLAFAIACGFINHLQFVVHQNWDYEDFHSAYMQNFDDYSGNFQLKAYSSEVDSITLVNKIRELTPVKIDELIPYEVYKGNQFRTNQKFDYLVFCQSPEYTPETADFMIEIIKEYIIEV